MLSKNEIKQIKSLHFKKNRIDSDYFIVEGTTIIEEVLKSDFKIIHIYALNQWASLHLKYANLIKIIDEVELHKISCLKTPNQVVAILQKNNNLNPIIDNSQLSIYLDGIKDPGNLGTIIRIADWFGIKQILLSEDSVDYYNPKVIQSTMGSFLRVGLCYKNLADINGLENINIFGAVLNGDSLYKINVKPTGLLIIGNEKNGIRNENLKYINYPITIPKIGEAESLNAAVATGIILSYFTK